MSDIDTPEPSPLLSSRAADILAACDSQDDDYMAVIAVFSWRAREALRQSRLKLVQELRQFLCQPVTACRAHIAVELDRRLQTEQAYSGGPGHRNLPWAQPEWDEFAEKWYMPNPSTGSANAGQRAFAKLSMSCAG